MNIIQAHTKELERACEQSRVKELYVFGSVLTDQFDSESDIDFIVTIDESDPLEYTEFYFQLKFALEKIFDRKVDLLEQKAIRNDLFQKKVDREKQLVYARRSQSLA